MCFCFGFSFNGGEKLSSHHFRGALKHALSDACDCAAHLDFALVGNDGHAVAFFEIEFAGAFQKSRLPFALQDHAKVTRRLDVLESNISCEGTLDRAYSCAEGRGVSVLSNRFEALAAWYATLQDEGVDQRVENPLAIDVELMGAFDLHGGTSTDSSLFCLPR